jgi:hypothetical protein
LTGKNPHFVFYLLVFLVVMLPVKPAQALEFFALYGPQNHTAVSGCCVSDGASNGQGIYGKFDLELTGALDALVFTNGLWTQGILLKPSYILGKPNRWDHGGHNSGAGKGLIEVKSISKFKWVTASGLGYYVQNGRTKDFNLPALTNGLVLSNANNFTYSLSDSWSAGFLLQFTYAISLSSQSVLWGGIVTVGYDFSSPGSP